MLPDNLEVVRSAQIGVAWSLEALLICSGQIILLTVRFLADFLVAKYAPPKSGKLAVSFSKFKLLKVLKWKQIRSKYLL